MPAEAPAVPSSGLANGTPVRPVSLIGIARSLVRSLAFGGALALAAADYAREACASRREQNPLPRRARWLQRWCRVFARIIGLRLLGSGIPPRAGMIVSNHLSYLDVIAFSALVPCVFVAKQEVAGWPIFGRFAQMAGTIFVDRTRRLAVADANCAIAAALRAGVVVVLFAEGTSSGGATVLPFRSSLLDPVMAAGSRIASAAVRYELEDGSVSDEVCYWGEMTLLPHLPNLLTKRCVFGQIRFAPSPWQQPPTSRKEAAARLRAEVAAMYHGLPPGEDLGNLEIAESPQPLRGDGLSGAELLGEKGDAEFLQQPAENLVLR